MPSFADLAVPIGGQIFGGILNRRAVNNATRRLNAGGMQAIDTINGGANTARNSLAAIYKRQQQTLNTFIDAGSVGLKNLVAGSGDGGEYNTPFNNDTFDLYKDPSFQFRLEQGQKALEAGANASGKRFTGATMKSLSDYNQNAASQEWQNAFGRYQTDTTNRFNRQMGLAGIGQNAANKAVDAGGTYGTNLANLDVNTAKQIADLQTEIASAQANGDIAKANSINDTINGILKTVSNAKTMAMLAPTAAKTAGAVLGIGGAGAAGAGALGTGLSGAIGAGTLSGAGIAADGTVVGTGVGAGGAGLGPAIAGFMTNPITIGVGAALIGGYALLKHFQRHQTADKWTQSVQTEFGQHLGQVVDNFDNLYAAGVLDKQTAQQIRDETGKMIGEVENQATQFASKGSKEKKIIDQFHQAMTKYFGPNWTNILGKMDQEIAGLPEGAPA